MRSPGGGVEPGQTPVFDEYTVVLKGLLRVEHRGGTLDVRAGQAVVVRAGEWVRYSTPLEEGAEYVAICTPAFFSTAQIGSTPTSRPSTTSWRWASM